VNNSREEVGDTLGGDSFSVEDIPSKLIMVDPSSPDGDINLIVYHSGKFHFYF